MAGSRLRTRIAGTGSYLPEKVLTNQDLEKRVDTTDKWIVTRTGIRERRIAARDQATSDLAFEAARPALEQAGVKARELDLILVATCTPDALFPSTACYLQNLLGAKKAAALDLNAACTGFVYGLTVADSMIRTGAVKNCLLVGAELLSRFINWNDRSTCILFADGAGAAVLVPSTRGRSEVLSTHLFADGQQTGLLCIPGLGSRKPATPAVLERNQHTVHMKGNETFKLAVKGMAQAAQQALKANDVTTGDIDLFVPHQANIRIIEATAKRLKIPMSKVMVNIDRYGNTSAATIPIALDEAARRGRIKRGDLVLLDAFGAGFTWGSALIRW
jgi:3-oxoacyl-[acyl-carrier-protein] synthase-3